MNKDLISQKIQQPMEYLLHCVGATVEVELKTGNCLKGILHAYDEHLNLLLSKVQEFTENAPDESFREMPILYVRGDMVSLVNKHYGK
jgi:small nuclear ribonucleoprotein (snRNP)-like protein